MFRFAETPDTIVAFFTESELRTEAQIIEAGTGIQRLLELASSLSKRLILDFRSLQIISSALLGPLVLANKVAKHKGVDFRLAGVEAVVMKVFAAARLDRVFRIERARDFTHLREASVVFSQATATKPCPECGEPLRTSLAKQCLHCGADWH